MKKIIMMLLLTVITLALPVGLSSCSDQHRSHQDSGVVVNQDSIRFVQFMQELQNPTFLSPDDVIAFRQQLDNQRQTDSVFRTIPTGIFTDIYNVLIHKFPDRKVTKSDIVNEFLSNRDIYSHIRGIPIEPLSNYERRTEIQNDTVKKGGSE